MVIRLREGGQGMQMYYNLVRRLLGAAEWKYISGYIGRNISTFTWRNTTNYDMLTPRKSLICHISVFCLFFWRGLGNEMSYERSSSNFNIFLGTNWLKFAHRVYIQILASWNWHQNPPNSHLLLLFFATFVQNEKAAAACKPNTDLCRNLSCGAEPSIFPLMLCC